MTEHQRIDLDDALRQPGRRAIDADWSARRKMIVGAAAALVAAGAIGGGAWAYLRGRPPALPRTMNEALAVMESGRLDRLDPQRRAQYTAEARRILWSISDEDRRALFRDEANREALRALREQSFDDMAYRIARGDQIDWSEFGPRERPQLSEEDRKRMEEMRQRVENMTPEEREKEMARRMEEMRAEMTKRTKEQLSSGNSQSGALRGEMMQRGGRGGFGGRGRGGGGGGGRGPR